MKLSTLIAALLFATTAEAGIAFDGTANAKAISNLVDTSTTPFSVCAAFFPVNVTAAGTIVTIGDTAAGNDYFWLLADGLAGGDPVESIVNHSATSGIAATTAGFTVAQHYACTVYTSSTSRTAYLDGANAGTNTTNVTPTGIDATAVGIFHRDTDSFPFNGVLAEIGIWNVALTASDVATLALGYTPPCVRADALHNYYMMLIKNGTTEPDIFGSTRIDLTLGSGTSTGTTHPRVIECQ